MDKDRIAGSAKEAKGAVKEAAGKIAGDAELPVNGQSDKNAGKVQNAVGGPKDTVRDRQKRQKVEFMPALERRALPRSPS